MTLARIRPIAHGVRTARRWAARALVLASLLILSGCGGGVPAGTALAQELWTSIGAKAIRPGFEIGLLYYDLENTSTSTIVIDSVGIAGPGIGTVVRPVQVRMAPLRFGWHHYVSTSVALSLYTTDPPVNFEGKGCRKQGLVPLKGFQMTPGSEARIWVVLRAMRPGRWVIPSHVIYYTQDGAEYRQVEPLRAYGLVADQAAYIPPYYAEAECVHPEGAAFLRGYHSGRVSG
ncbi:MAG TPA: hypothetical protein VN840_20040 [Streptosporangiaceae bacterium]|nr:hypothetical protein [Streptosporangiaceae bacterium]